MFKVVPDQLRVSDGWVRCGQCNEVFDANTHLQTKVGDEPVNTPPVRHKTVAEVKTPLAPVRPLQVAGTTGPTEAVPKAPFLEADAPVSHGEPVDIPPSLPVADVKKAAPQSMESPLVVAADEARATDGEAVQHTFMQVHGSSARTSPRWVRFAQSLSCILLALLLLAQVLIQERDRIVATEPSTKGFLEPLCSVVGCRISPLRQIESVVIDSSSFAKVRLDVFRLHFTLKNTAQVPIAIPALELTLTDMQDQAVVRKVFLAADFAKQQSVLGPGAELTATVPMVVKLAGNTERVSGYRLLSFYP